ncbi:argininosuccinate synthase [Methanoplanus endosymbiosus]|uniref:Argininosuccinate synthase n=1 Tax=Methanoplanus endosymbiosus TaxID=33865 RepID=A0A9E7PMP6_9EURY|nr:argininosuccinate synthase [Methanoplanus endosymbiosus]UUX93065.1 argininosuccinate synthase [Methanoplanus endosymbiosus]
MKIKMINYEKYRQNSGRKFSSFHPGIIAVLFLMAVFIIQPGFCATEELTISRFGADGSLIDEKTYTYQWLEENLPVYGDGVTHYYMQGPTFDEADEWNPAEDVNVLSRDMGAVKGTDIKDICDTVGGMTPGGTIKILSDDGFSKKLDYDNIYNPKPRQGPVCVCWYNGEESSPEAKAQGSGYPPEFYSGMRIVFFADDSVNPWGYHVFGNEDMRETVSEENMHYFNGEWPSSGGLSVKYVEKLEMYEPEIPAGDETKEGSTADDNTKTPLSVFCIIAAVFACFAVRRI